MSSLTKPDAVASPARARQALILYLGQTDRALVRLVDVCASNGLKVSVATVKRWSARYNWRHFVQEHDKMLQRNVVTAIVDSEVDRLRTQFEAMRVMEERFFANIDNDIPQRKRATDMTFNRWIKLLRAEEQLHRRIEKLGEA